MKQALPSHPDWQDEVFSPEWQVGQQYYVHGVGSWAGKQLPDGLYRVAEVAGQRVRFEGSTHLWGPGHVRLFHADWRTREQARLAQSAAAPVFIPLSALRVRQRAAEEKK